MGRSYVRKPSIKKSVSARTKGKVTRAVKSSINPMYGKKGLGWVNDPHKALYNKVYNKTSVGVRDLGSSSSSYSSCASNYSSSSKEITGFGVLLRLILGFGIGAGIALFIAILMFC